MINQIIHQALFKPSHLLLSVWHLDCPFSLPYCFCHVILFHSVPMSFNLVLTSSMMLPLILYIIHPLVYLDKFCRIIANETGIYNRQHAYWLKLQSLLHIITISIFRSNPLYPTIQTPLVFDRLGDLEIPINWFIMCSNLICQRPH